MNRNAHRDRPAARERSRSVQKRRPSAGGPQQDMFKNGDRTLRIRNLSRNVEEPHLREIFKAYGTVKRALIGRDQKCNVNLGYGLVEMATFKEAEQAADCFHGGWIDGKEVAVTIADPDAGRAGTDSDKNQVASKKDVTNKPGRAAGASTRGGGTTSTAKNTKAAAKQAAARGKKVQRKQVVESSSSSESDSGNSSSSSGEANSSSSEEEEENSSSSESEESVRPRKKRA
ncbi:unnamed protein product [Amoebophrya sp. A120]|nr:unnamed protein product [Amoebophrya sp. A120]|eukprot:GSA120T00003922001.1